jgi:hypothetical protein
MITANVATASHSNMVHNRRDSIAVDSALGFAECPLLANSGRDGHPQITTGMPSASDIK